MSDDTPRYYANRLGGNSWVTVDREADPSPFFPARFEGEGAEQHARVHADKLNTEEQP